MALVNTNEMLAKARDQKYAVGNFDIFNIEMLHGVIDGAKELNSPLILAFGKDFEKITPLEHFAAYIKSLVEDTHIPIALHLDHATDTDFIMRAIRAGYTSVMIDASKDNLENNIIKTKKIVDICREINVSVEAELGRVKGLEFGIEDTMIDEDYTDPEEAIRFVAETGINSLAVAIGTVHGTYQKEPNLNFKRLKELHDSLSIPLVLHGGSGLSSQDLKKCISDGISKINIHTDLTVAALKSLDDKSNESDSYMEKCHKIRLAIKKTTQEKIHVMDSINKA